MSGHSNYTFLKVALTHMLYLIAICIIKRKLEKKVIEARKLSVNYYSRVYMS
jgi:hypothetical protein